MSRSESVFATLPDPGRAGTLDDLTDGLRALKVLAGDPSYGWIKDRVNEAWRAAGRPAGELAGRSTVADCFRPGRRRLNSDLVIAVVQALRPDVGYVTQWRQALQVIGGERQAAAQVRVQDGLPQALAGFTGRTAELDLFRRAVPPGGGEGAIFAISGMPGVGKTQLAVRAGHLLLQENAADKVLFVNLRGFHPDPAQPPADPAAVLDGFLRLLGVPGQQVPHGLPARVAAYRDRLASTRTLVVLDDAADEDQVRPLLPETAGCSVLVTSRRRLAALPRATHLTVDVFTPDEAVALLTRVAPHVPVGPDPDAPARLAHRCGHLPLALGLIAGHIRGKAGWTLTDHADRLDERHHDRRLDTGVELALDLSYRHLPADRQRLLRFLALHPGQDVDAHTVAALVGSALTTARTRLDHLRRDHLVQEGTSGRYALHDLVRAYAAGRASDEDPPGERHAALTRLFDHYLSSAATAMHTLYPAETGRRPRIVGSTGPIPALTDPDTARAWLDTERPTLVVVAGHTATRGWPTHTTRLASTLFRYLAGGHHADALTIHGHARDAAHRAADPAGEAHALTNLGIAHLRLGRHGPAAAHFQRAMRLFGQVGDPAGEARARGNLGNVEGRLGHYRPAAHHHEQALALCRQAGDRIGEVDALNNLGILEGRLGRHQQAAHHHEQALALCRQTGDSTGEAWVLTALGEVEARLGRYGPSAEHLQQALTLCRQAGDRTGEAWAMDTLGILHTHRGQAARAAVHHHRALAIFRATGQRDGEAWALNGLGEAAHSAGRPADALVHHAAADVIAGDIGDRYQQARAHSGLGLAHDALDDRAAAARHYRQASTLYTHLGTPDADRMRACLAAVEDRGREQR